MGEFDKLEQLQKEFKHIDYGFAKYFNYRGCIETREEIYKWLNITKIPSKMLDISTGFGYFPYICRKKGHEVYYTDIECEYNLLCTKAREALGLTDCITMIYPNDSFCYLPDDIGKFDVITAFAVPPHSFYTKEIWLEYIKDLKSHLNVGGFLYIEPNFGGGHHALLQLAPKYNWIIRRRKLGVKIKL